MEEAKLRVLSSGLYRLLDDHIGNDRIIKMGREVVKLHNMVNDCIDKEGTTSRIIVGSQAEGLMTNGTDNDAMYVHLDIKVQQEQNEDYRQDHEEHKLVVQMVQNQSKPGFTLLKILYGNSNYSTEILDGLYLSSERWKSNSPFSHENASITGPCTSGKLGNFEHDLTEVIKLPNWPEIGRNCIQRLRHGGWPHQETISLMVKQGCHLVPKSSKISRYPNEEWMISFALAEQILITKITHCQFLCYCLLKIFLKEAVNEALSLPKHDLMSSYFAKTAILWELSAGRFQCSSNTMLECFWTCFRLLINWLSKGYMPNFFVPANNMLDGKFTDNREILLKHLISLYKDGYRCLYKCPTLQTCTEAALRLFFNKCQEGEISCPALKTMDLKTFVSKCNITNGRIIDYMPSQLPVLTDHPPYRFLLKSKDRTGMVWVQLPEATLGPQSRFYSNMGLTIENFFPSGPSHEKDIDKQVDLVRRIESVKKRIKNKSDVQEHTLATWFHICSIKLIFTYFMSMVTESKIPNRRLYRVFLKVKHFILKRRDDLVTEKLYYAIILHEMGKDDRVIAIVKDILETLLGRRVVYQFLMSHLSIYYSEGEVLDFQAWKRKYLAKQIELKTNISISELRLEHKAAESFNPLFDSIIYPPVICCNILLFLSFFRKKDFKKCNELLDQFPQYLQEQFLIFRDWPIGVEAFGVFKYMMSEYDFAYDVYLVLLIVGNNFYRATCFRMLVLLWKYWIPLKLRNLLRPNSL